MWESLSIFQYDILYKKLGIHCQFSTSYTTKFRERERENSRLTEMAVMLACPRHSGVTVNMALHILSHMLIWQNSTWGLHKSNAIDFLFEKIWMPNLYTFLIKKEEKFQFVEDCIYGLIFIKVRPIKISTNYSPLVSAFIHL